MRGATARNSDTRNIGRARQAHAGCVELAESDRLVAATDFRCSPRRADHFRACHCRASGVGARRWRKPRLSVWWLRAVRRTGAGEYPALSCCGVPCGLTQITASSAVASRRDDAADAETKPTSVGGASRRAGRRHRSPSARTCQVPALGGWPSPVHSSQLPPGPPPISESKTCLFSVDCRLQHVRRGAASRSSNFRASLSGRNQISNLQVLVARRVSFGGAICKKFRRIEHANRGSVGGSEFCCRSRGSGRLVGTAETGTPPKRGPMIFTGQVDE